MPGVPTYDNLQVTPQAPGRPDLSSVASPEVLGGAADSRMKLAEAVTSAGTGAVQVAYTMQQRENADMVFRAETAVKDAYIKQEQEWRQQKQGRFAEGLTQDAHKWWDDQIEKNGKELRTDEQRRLFQQRAIRYRTQSLNAVSSWETQQLERAHDESWSADKNVTKSMAAANATPESVDNARLEIKRLNTYQAARKGWDASTLQAANMADTTDLHNQVLQQLAQTNPQQAATYFEKFKDEIDGTRQAEIGKFAKTATATHLGEAAAAGIWDKLGPKFDDAPVELDKMEAEVRKQFKDNDFALKAGLAALHERAASHNSSQAERQAANTNAVMDAVRQGSGINEVRRMGEFAALPGKARNEIEEHIATRANIMEARDLAAQSRLEREQMIKFSAAYHSYSDPDVLSKMTRPQVQALEPTLGRHYTDSLLSKHEALGKHEGALSEARVDNDAFKAIVRDFGFDPDKKPGKGTADIQNVARIGAMRDEVERQIGIEQKAKNRLLTREEKDTVARRTLSSSVLRSTWFGISSEAMPAAAVIPADLKKIKVPDSDRESIKAELVRRNRPVTDEEIARWYLLGQKRK